MQSIVLNELSVSPNIQKAVMHARTVPVVRS